MLERNKSIVRRVFEEIFNQRNLTVADEIIASNYVLHDPALPPSESVHGIEGYKSWASIYLNAFPDLEVSIDDQIAERDKVVTLWEAYGIQHGQFLAIPPTGREVTITATQTSRLTNDKIEEEWLQWDVLGMLQQVGVLPPPSESSDQAEEEQGVQGRRF